MEGTMSRTRKYLAYFGRSFLRDKVALFFLFLIIATIIAIIYLEVKYDDVTQKKNSSFNDM